MVLGPLNPVSQSLDGTSQYNGNGRKNRKDAPEIPLEVSPPAKIMHTFFRPLPDTQWYSVVHSHSDESRGEYAAPRSARWSE